MTGNSPAPRLPLFAVAALIGAIAAAAIFPANGFDLRAIDWRRIHVALLFALPPLAGIALLAIPPRRPVGIVFTAAIGTVGFLALALPIGVMTIFIVAGTREQWIDYFAYAGYALAMLVAAVSGWRAHFGLPREMRRSATAATALVAALVFAWIGWIYFQARMAEPYDRAALIRGYNDAQARKTVAAIGACAATQNAGGTKGFPVTIRALVEGGCKLGKLGLGENGWSAGANGYVFYYFTDPPDAQGKLRRFAACARPNRDDSGTLVIGIDPVGGSKEIATQAFKPAPPCFDAWTGSDDRGYLYALAGCVMSGAQLRPGRGYPPYLFMSGDTHAGACTLRPLEEIPGSRTRTSRGIVEYRPAPEARGVIDGYRLALYPAPPLKPLELDHLGQVRELAPLGDTVDATALEAARPAATVRARDVDVKRRELAAACSSGRLDVCEDLGDFEMRNGAPLEAERVWADACRRGRLQSCLLSGRFNPTTDPRDARSYKERCLQGEARYCDRLAEQTRELAPRIEELRQRGGFPSSDDSFARTERRRRLPPMCEAGDAEACEILGDLEWEEKRADEAMRLWDRACEGARPYACLLGKRYNPAEERERVLMLRGRCYAGVFDACRDVDALVRTMRPQIDALLAKGR